jgi:ribosomal protein L11 methyltransferase
MGKNWTRIDIKCGPQTAEYLACEFAQAFELSVEFIPEGIRIYRDSARFAVEESRVRDILRAAAEFEPAEPDPILSMSEIPDEDWSETWKAHFKPLRVGNHFLITTTWEEATAGPADLVIRIDPGRAFGTGHHETTRLCLEWLESFAQSRPSGSPPGTLLDVGTGSGILAIGAALLGFEGIVGIDNDPDAIEVAVENIELNGFAGNDAQSPPPKIVVFCATPQEVSGGFDVVISNIQSLPLMRMSETMVSKVNNPGRLILSGILVEQADEVRTEYEKKGLKFTGEQIAGEWILLSFEK